MPSSVNQGSSSSFYYKYNTAIDGARIHHKTSLCALTIFETSYNWWENLHIKTIRKTNKDEKSSFKPTSEVFGNKIFPSRLTNYTNELKFHFGNILRNR